MPATAFPVSPRTDLRTGFFWIALGAVLVFASWRMDRMEQQGDAFHGRVRQGFLTEAAQQPDRITVVDAGESVDQVQAAIRKAVGRMLAR